MMAYEVATEPIATAAPLLVMAVMASVAPPGYPVTVFVSALGLPPSLS